MGAGQWHHAGVRDRRVRNRRCGVPGGAKRNELEWKESDGHVYMTGGATTVFEGEWNE